MLFQANKIQIFTAQIDLQQLPINKMEGTCKKTAENTLLKTFHQSSMKEQIKFQSRIKENMLLPLSKDVTWIQYVRKHYLTVDKSMFIKAVIQSSSSKNILITRPRYWGKSMNMNMLKCFLEMQIDRDGNKVQPDLKLIYPQLACSSKNQQKQENKPKEQGSNKENWEFENLKIFQDKEFVIQHYKKYVVLNFNFNFNFGQGDLNQTLIRKAIIQQLLQFLKKHLYLKNTDMKMSFEHLYQRLIMDQAENDKYLIFCRGVKHLFQIEFGAQIILLIDQYDSIYSKFIDEEQTNDLNIQKVKKCLRIITSFIETMSLSCKLTVVSGIRNFFYSAEKMFEDSLHGPQFEFQDYFGFKEKEISSLISSLFKSQNQSHIKANQLMLNKIKKLYKGFNVYKFPHRDPIAKLFNPYSVIKYLQQRIANQKQLFEGKDMTVYDQKQLFFWTNSVPQAYSIKRHFKNIGMADLPKLLEKLMNIFDPQKQQGLPNTQIFLFQNIIEKRYFSEKGYQIQGALYHFLVNGYLTVENQHFKIPNAEMMHFFEQIIISGIKQKISDLKQSNLFSQIKADTDFRKWYDFKTSLEVCLRVLKMITINFNEAIFNTCFILCAAFVNNKMYRLQYQFKKNSLQVFMFVPQQAENKLFILHEHRVAFIKVMKVPLQLQNILKQIQPLFQEAFFQILFENYFAAALEYKNWKQLMVRCVVGIECTGVDKSTQSLIEAKEYKFIRQDVLAIQKYWKQKQYIFTKNSRPLATKEIAQFKKKNLQIQGNLSTISLLRSITKNPIYLTVQNLKQFHKKTIEFERFLMQCPQYIRDILNDKFEELLEELYNLKSLQKQEIIRYFGDLGLVTSILNLIECAHEEKIYPQKESL